MKKLTYTIISIAFAVLVLSACSRSDEYNFSSSIFIPDEDYLNLPMYSEMGYNTFGTYFDRTPFVSDNLLIPIKIIVQSDTCRMAFSGKFISDNTEAVLTFHLANFTPKSYADLLSLNAKNFHLAESGCMVTLQRKEKKDTLQMMEGEFTIKRAQKLIVDKEALKTVLSGTFSMKTHIDNLPVFINNGRFDVNVGNDNFFSIK